MKSEEMSRGGGRSAPDPSVSLGMTGMEKPSYWAVLVAPVLYNPDLPDFTKLLYAVISSLTEQTGYCWASNERLARDFRKTTRTIQRSLRELQEAGYIRIEDGDGGPGRRKIYAGLSPMAGNHDKNVTVTMTKMSRDHDKNVTQNNKENTKETNPPKAPQGAAWEPTMFDRFWKLYPKKKDKAKAIREWDRLKADRKLMGVMSAALRAQMASEEWQRDNGRAVPYPCRWLSHRRWEDELEEPAAAPAETREELPWI